MGDPLTAPKCPKMYPKPLDFLLSTSNVISMQSYHSKIDYAVTMLSRPTLAVSIHIISPICDHGGPPHSPKTVKTTPKTTRFSFVHVQHPPPTCIKVISSPKASNGQRFPCPALLFFGYHGGSWAAALIGDKVLCNGEIFFMFVRHGWLAG